MLQADGRQVRPTARSCHMRAAGRRAAPSTPMSQVLTECNEGDETSLDVDAAGMPTLGMLNKNDDLDRPILRE